MKEIIMLPGDTIEQAVLRLLEAKEKGESVYCDFNGHKLYSDTVSMDSAYLEITGKTKVDFDKEKEEWCKKYLEDEKNWKKHASENISNWIEKGEKLIFPERYDDWIKCVITCARGIYYGLDLDYALEIMTLLKDGSTIEQVLEVFKGQSHSGTIESIVRQIVFLFSDRGPEFIEATAYDEISLEDKKIIEAKKQENIKLTEINNLRKSNLEKIKIKNLGEIY